MALFDSFVVFAEMRTGSNLLEDYINQIEGVTCFGEAFNPNFVGYPNRSDILGVSQRQREDNPNKLLNAVRASDGMGGFRYFHDHDPRVLPAILSDTRCAKIILTRNPLDSYVSLKIARATDQWKLTNVKNRKDAKAHFDLLEFERHMSRTQTFQLEVMHTLQVTGQTAYYIGYDDLHDTEVLSGLATWLGLSAVPESFETNLKPQNPQPLTAKVSNFDQMDVALRGLDQFDVTRTPNFEPRRGPVVPSYKATATLPLLYMPIRSGPEQQVTQWMMNLQAGGDLISKFTQKTLRRWMQDNPGHRRFTVLRHPLARAHAAFCDTILSTGPGSFTMIRNQLTRFHGVDLPEDEDDPGYDDQAHLRAFDGFLRFLRANLNGQTSVRVDAHWASQVACCQGMADFCLPDRLVREEEMADALADMAEAFGLEDHPPAPDAGHVMDDRLRRIYSPQLEALCRDAYPRDYMMFGFGDLDLKNPA